MATKPAPAQSTDATISRRGFFMGAVLLSAGFLCYGARFALRKSNSSARQLLTASIVYLPSLFVLIILLRR